MKHTIVGSNLAESKGGLNILTPHTDNGIYGFKEDLPRNRQVVGQRVVSKRDGDIVSYNAEVR